MEHMVMDVPMDPYHYALRCIGGKWKMTILHTVFSCGKLRFNQILKALPVSEKVLSQQLKELVRDGLVRRAVDADAYPPAIEYSLTDAGNRLIPVLEDLHAWSARQMDALGIPIDPGAGENGGGA